jgi:hypothetical protein
MQLQAMELKLKLFRRFIRIGEANNRERKRKKPWELYAENEGKKEKKRIEKVDNHSSIF